MEEELDVQGPSGPTAPRAPLALRSGTRARLSRLGSEFLADILAREVRRNPTNRVALGELAHVYTSLGRLEDGLEADLALLDLDPTNPIVHYNLGCSYALLGRLEAALDALEAAVARGYDDVDFLATDEDLLTLHSHPRFVALVRALETR